MQTKATAKFIRQSPRKVRLVLDMIKNMPVRQAQEQLKFVPKSAATAILKLVNSAVANAKNNNKLREEDLFVKQAFVDQGPTIKRWRPRAFGRAGMIRKRTSHLTVVLSDKKGEEKKAVKPVSKAVAKPATNSSRGGSA